MFRTVVIKKSSKIQYLQGYLVIYDGDTEQKVFLNDISLLLVEATGTLMTYPLLIECIKRNIAVIFCNEKHNPIGTILGLSNHYNNSGNIYKQIEWKYETKINLWKKIVESKISMQINALKLYEKENVILNSYVNEVLPNDKTNREGLAAKVYFSEMFGYTFNRSEETNINALLDYGYSIILSCFNREIVASGYLTQLGIFHQGKTNPYNLSSDFMEPFRPLVDVVVNESKELKKPLTQIRKLLTFKINVDNEERYVDDAIRVYVMSCIRYLNEESSNIPQLKLKSLEHYRNGANDENIGDV